MYQISEKLTLYYSWDAEMPALLLKGSWDVQFAKKFDVESFVTEEK